MTVLEERDVAHLGNKTATFRADDIRASAEFRIGHHCGDRPILKV